MCVCVWISARLKMWGPCQPSPVDGERHWEAGVEAGVLGVGREGGTGTVRTLHTQGSGWVGSALTVRPEISNRSLSPTACQALPGLHQENAHRKEISAAR